MKRLAWGRMACLLVAVGVAFGVRAQFGGAGPGGRAGIPSGPGRGVPPSPFPSPQTPVSQGPGDQGAAIKAETILVPVRVVVRSANGRAVTGLKKDDFKLYQDGKQQEITSFTPIHIGGASGGASAASSSSPSTSGSAEGAARSEPDAAAVAEPAQFVALFIDDVHLYFAEMAQIRGAARKYLASLHPEDRIAIVTASGEGALDFTGDRDALEAAMAKLQPHPFPGATSALMMASSSPCPPAMTYTEANAIARSGSEGVLTAAGRDFAACYHLGGMEDPLAGPAAGAAMAQGAAIRTQEAGEMATDAVFSQMERSVRRLSTMPGRRVVVMVSPGFVYSGRQKQFAGIISLANHYSVVINTLDSFGLWAGEGKYDPDRFERFGFGHFEVEQPILEDLADGTGGRFVKNNNDFAGVMREMGEAPEAYYVLAYAPQGLAADGKYHMLKVTLAHRSTDSVEARRGFYAPDGLETPEQAAKREIDDALFSDEEQHDLPVKFETQVTIGEAGSQKVAVKGHIDFSQLRFMRAGGVNHEEVTVSASVFDRNGNYVEGMWKSDQMDLKDSTLAELEKSGFYLEIDFDLKPGDYVVREVARDLNDGHISEQSTPVNLEAGR